MKVKQVNHSKKSKQVKKKVGNKSKKVNIRNTKVKNKLDLGKLTSFGLS